MNILYFLLVFLIVRLILDMVPEYLGYSLKTGGARTTDYFTALGVTFIIAFCLLAARDKRAKNHPGR